MKTASNIEDAIKESPRDTNILIQPGSYRYHVSASCIPEWVQKPLSIIGDGPHGSVTLAFTGGDMMIHLKKDESFSFDNISFDAVNPKGNLVHFYHGHLQMRRCSMFSSNPAGIDLYSEHPIGIRLDEGRASISECNFSHLSVAIEVTEGDIIAKECSVVHCVLIAVKTEKGGSASFIECAFTNNRDVFSISEGEAKLISCIAKDNGRLISCAYDSLVYIEGCDFEKNKQKWDPINSPWIKVVNSKAP